MIKVIIIVEGKTEKQFVKQVLSKYFYPQEIYLQAAEIGKAGHKGGNAKFDRAIIDIRNFLNYPNVFVSTMFDFYGISSKWPGKDSIDTLKNTGKALTSLKIGEEMNENMIAAVKKALPIGDRTASRFKPYFQVHEFEALLFSNRDILEEHLEGPVDSKYISQADFNDPEMINDNWDTRPSQRLKNIFSSHSHKYSKKVAGIDLAKAIGIDIMRKNCPNFAAWLGELEALAVANR